ncbi:hypothetical protein QAD02_008623 [Eretmocerus hayati]|uniref:Uncharacterized protein n=1 Tax=Eretmocerus hayati TaxID=131215 RepID=A0ACC2N7U3_9HYME|nr:hypothetical protein QAD02_008623 [Eretmocerus hayati]
MDYTLRFLVLEESCKLSLDSDKGWESIRMAKAEHFDHTRIRTLAICSRVTQANFLERNWREESSEESLDFVQDHFIEKARNCSDEIQTSENVAEGIIKILQEAKPHDTWVSDANELSYAVRDPPYYKDRKIDI